MKYNQKVSRPYEIPTKNADHLRHRAQDICLTKHPPMYNICSGFFKEIAAMDITENKLKEIIAGKRSEFQHVVGIFKEDLESKINLIAEQYRDIKSTQKTHTEMIGSLMEDVQIVKSDVQFLKVELKRKVDYDEFDALTKRVALLEAKIRK